MLQADALGIRVANRELVRALDLRLAPGQFIAVLGCNGSGKTLTLQTLAGLRPADHGEVRLHGASIRPLPSRHRARQLAFLPQDFDTWGAATAIETVRIGRYAHASTWALGGPNDDERVIAAMRATGVESLAQRTTVSLSGGEQRRVAIATVLAQDAPIALLDEPTNHLDPQHAIAMLQLFAAQAERGGAVIATLHDATLAARFASHVLLLFGDGRWEYGPAADVLQTTRLSELYATPIIEARVAGRRLFAAG